MGDREPESLSPPELAAPEVEVDIESPSDTLDRVLTIVDPSYISLGAPQVLALTPPPTLSGLQLASLLEIQGETATVVVIEPEPNEEPKHVLVAKHMDLNFLQDARSNGHLVLLGGPPHRLRIVGVVQTSYPRTINAQSIEINASESLTLKSGRAGVQLRSDGSVEVIGSSIRATSRGLFRLIGRALRLN
jgi:hypothetical protein